MTFRHLQTMRDKRGISVVIGYVLLISIAIIISVIVYQWIKTYVPTEALQCTEGISVYVSNSTFDCSSPGNIFNLTIKNSGRFSIAGYYIHVSNESDQELSTIDISGNLDSGGENRNGAILYTGGSSNTINPGMERTSVFDLSDSGINKIYSAEIIPVRYQEVNDIQRFVSCSYARIVENICT